MRENLGLTADLRIAPPIDTNFGRFVDRTPGDTLQQPTHDRRAFLIGAGGSVGFSLLAAQWPGIAAAHSHAVAMAAAPTDTTLELLDTDEARLVDALTAQIVPTDDTPGAREAGALYFIDRSLRTWASYRADDFRSSLRDFQAAYSAANPGTDFASASDEMQIAYLSTVDSTPFFASVRFLTLLGLFALPAYGGNRDGIGWKLIGFEDTHTYAPPFGYYDRDYPGFFSAQGTK